jgi:type IV pilus assembly protein PilB
MSISQPVLVKIIEDSDLVAKSDLKHAQNTARHLNCSLATVLIGRDLIQSSQLGTLLAKHYKVPFIDLAALEIDSADLQLIPEKIAAERGVMAFRREAKTVSIAMHDPKDLETQEIVRKSIGSGTRLQVHFTLETSLKTALKKYQKNGRHPDGELKISRPADTSAVSLIERFIEEAMRDDASDIHLEPLEKEVLVRIRIDGVLNDRIALPKDIHDSLIARIKILADLKIDEHRLPQDGQFTYQNKRHEKRSLRVSIIPTVYGEKIVLRILEDSLSKFALEELGLLPEDQELIEHALQKTHGMFLMTGPTGSGKTTSLYTILGLINRPDLNLVTIEDPVENRIRRINQTQVNPAINLTFAAGLRSILRQDPDVVMVGEIRDQETAIIAVNAAMTGHLVFSSVHANTAAGAIPRMFDLGIEPFLLASTLNLVAAQRLVRVLCLHCRKEIPISPTLKKRLDATGSQQTSPYLKKVNLNYEPVGCSACNYAGYKGRTGLFEILKIDDTVQELIVNKATSLEIWNYAHKNGAKSMLEDGYIKVQKGITTLEEVLRVIS